MLSSKGRANSLKERGDLVPALQNMPIRKRARNSERKVATRSVIRALRSTIRLGDTATKAVRASSVLSHTREGTGYNRHPDGPQNGEMLGKEAAREVGSGPEKRLGNDQEVEEANEAGQEHRINRSMNVEAASGRESSGSGPDRQESLSEGELKNLQITH